MPQPHEILQIPPDATKSDVEAAYRRLAMYADPADARYRATLDAARMAMLDDEPPKAAEATPIMAHRTGAGFAVGDVFSRTFSTLFGNPALFFGLTLVAWVPGTAVQLVFSAGAGDVSPTMKFVIWLVSLALGMIAQGAAAYAALHILRGKPTTVGESLKQGLSRLGAVLLLTLFITAAFVASGFVLLILPFLIVRHIGSAIATIVGAIVLLIAVPIVMCMWYVAVPACVVERLGPLKSLKRSTALTKGYRWKVFGLISLLLIATFALAGFGAFVLALLFSWSKILLTLATQVLMILPQALWCVMTPITYYGLRAAKEGVSVDSLANVFD